VIASIREPCDETIIRAGLASAPCSRTSEKWVLAATILGSSLAFIDGTVVNVALPALQAELKANLADVQWVIEAYALLLAALLLVGGSLGDRYGRRRVFVVGVGIFAFASAWCGVAGGIGQLILARALQGFGAALLVPGSLAIISSAFREEERGRAIGTWSGFSAITAAVGPVLGGWLIEHVSWRAIFFINIPLAIIVIVIAIRHVPESASGEKGRLDWWGASLATLSLGTLVFALIESSTLSFAHPAVIASLVLAAISIIAFVIRERTSKEPMLPLQLFRSRTFTGANVLTLLLYSALGGTLFFLPLNLIQVQRYNATSAGAALLPFILIMFLLSRWSGGLVQRFGAKIPLIIGPIIAASGFLLFIFSGVGGSYWLTFFPAVVVLGVGMAVTVAPLTTTVMNSVPQNRAGIASGINNAVSRAAGLLAIALFGVVMLHTFSRGLDDRLRDLKVSGTERQPIIEQRTRLAAAELPSSLPAERRGRLRTAIDRSFVAAFNRVMRIGSVLALAAAGTAGLLIGRKGPQLAESRNCRSA
jgi:EmrB/QacA subfamily drug resistance transporter